MTATDAVHPPITLRRATAADAALVASLGRALFADTFAADNTPADLDAYLDAAFTEDAIARALADDRTYLWLASDGVAHAGYVQLRLDAPVPEDVDRATLDAAGIDADAAGAAAEIVRLYAARAVHGRGVGARLMTVALDAARDHGARAAWLGVWERNARAIAFYEKSGFVRVGTQRFVLGTDVQRDWVMARPLPAERR